MNKLIDLGKASLETMGQKPDFFPDPGNDPQTQAAFD